MSLFLPVRGPFFAFIFSLFFPYPIAIQNFLDVFSYIYGRICFFKTYAEKMCVENSMDLAREMHFTDLYFKPLVENRVTEIESLEEKV